MYRLIYTCKVKLKILTYRTVTEMSKYLSNNAPLLSCEKKTITNFPSDARHITPIYNMVQNWLGKYISMDQVLTICYLLLQYIVPGVYTVQPE